MLTDSCFVFLVPAMDRTAQASLDVLPRPLPKPGYPYRQVDALRTVSSLEGAVTPVEVLRLCSIRSDDMLSLSRIMFSSKRTQQHRHSANDRSNSDRNPSTRSSTTARGGLHFHGRRLNSSCCLLEGRGGTLSAAALRRYRDFAGRDEIRHRESCCRICDWVDR